MIGSADARRRVLKQCYFAARRAGRVNARALRRHARDDHLLVLSLHGVSPQSNPYGPSLHPDLFAELLAWLQPRTRPCVLGEVRTTEADPQRPRLVLSFDDGLLDFVEHAMPVLNSLGVRANQNIIGEAMDTGRPPWTVEMLDLLGAAPIEAVKRLRVPAFNDVLSDDHPYAKERFGAAITGHFKLLTRAEREVALASLQEQLGNVVVEQPTRMMSAGDVAAAHNAGHEIGSHSYSHESMEHVEDDEFLADFERSRDSLRGAGCGDCDVYAFPNGSHRAGQPELLLARGIRHVLLVDERPSHASATVHPRLTVRGHTQSELRARAVNGLEIIS